MTSWPTRKAQQCMDKALQRLDHATIQAALACATPREEQIIRLVHGLGEMTPQGFAEIAPRFGVRAERVRGVYVAGVVTVLADLAGVK